MNICNEENKLVEFKVGNLYMVKAPSTYSKDQVYLYTNSKKMVRLSNGSDTTIVTNTKYWVDVTDKYCLQKVK